MKTTTSGLVFDTTHTLGRRAVCPCKVISWFPLRRLLFVAAVALNLISTANAAVRYVNVAGASPAAPYTSWATAARTIQDAIDVAVADDEIVVTNGVYAIGGQMVSAAGATTNRVAVTKPVTVRSVNGPEATVIQGNGPIGNSAVRCVYLTNGAALAGFTLTKGATSPAGGSFAGGGVWCQSTNAVVSNCIVVSNSSRFGGGAWSGTLNNCTLSGNSAIYGDGGGASSGRLNNCTLIGNSAEDFGGGASACTLNNCALTGNSAGLSGGGTDGGTLNNCTLTGNSATYFGGGGASHGTLNNCIVYYNTANVYGPNYVVSTLNFSCTTPLPASGTGNIGSEPRLASTSHLSATSPCRAAGSAAYTRGVDIDGELWANPPSIGCDEYRPESITGPLNVAIRASVTQVVVGVNVEFTALITGHAGESRWDFGDGTVDSNRPYATHSWQAPGEYPVVLTAYNESYPEGVTAALTVRVEEGVHYVSMNSTNPAAPYTSWATAATNIQDAIDSAVLPGSVVRVTNGVYATGGRAVRGTLTNRVAVTRQVTIRSVNGPTVTWIAGRRVPGTTHGNSAVRCVYLTNGAALVGFTLTNGATRTTGDPYHEQGGGGVWCESASAVVSNCVLVGNSAFDEGGGAYGGTLENCMLIGNSAFDAGGGAYGGAPSSSILINCILAGNSARFGGAVNSATLNNCTITGNSASSRGGGAEESRLNNCTLFGNSANEGGGAAYGTLNNCTLTGNSARLGGGGAWSSTLNNCTLTGNSADQAGGALYGTLRNCIVYYNAANVSNANYYSSTLSFSCTTPLPVGVGNITSEPAFVDLAGGNLRLASNSPCLNAGNKASVPGSTDLDGRPRIVGGRVDIGAYEYQSAASGIFIGWLQQYGLSTDGSADNTDPDGDRLNNYQEWRAGTNPTNRQSVLRLMPPLLIGSDLVVTWESVPGRIYFLESSTNLASSASFQPLAANIQGEANTTTYTHTNATGAGLSFYRVGVE